MLSANITFANNIVATLLISLAPNNLYVGSICHPKMIHSEFLFSWQQNFVWVLALTSGLILASRREVVLATEILDKLVEQESDGVTIPRQKLPSKLLPRLTLTQLPNPIPPRKIELPELPLQDSQPEPEIPIELKPPPTPLTPDNPQIPRTITVQKFKLVGNTAFSDEELEKTVEKFTNRPISLAELLQVEEEISNKYTAGCQKEPKQQQEDTEQQKTPQKPCYLNSGAFIPANQIFDQDGAVVEVKVVEGSIEQINITGLKKLHQNYVRGRLQRGISQPLEREQLLEQLQILQLNPLIQNLSAELAAGSRLGKSILEVKVIEADSFNVELFTNNGRAPSVGTWRRGIRVNEDNLLGLGDRLFGEYTNTDGSNKIDLGYSLPLNASNTTLNMAGGINKTEVIEEPFDSLDIEGDSFNLEFGLRQPILRTPTQELALGISGTRQESQTKLSGENFTISSGSDENGSTRISALRFYQEYTKRTLEDVLAVRSQFSVGLDVFDATVNANPLPDSRFFAWRGQGQYVRRLAQNSLLVLRSELQLAATNLVPLEEFSLGGLDSVRGYRQDALLTDNGFFTSAEMRLAIYQVQSVQGLLSIVPFFDLGIGWNDNSDDNPEENFLVGLGLGLQWQMGDDFSARLDYGIPLMDVEDSDDTLQENGLYFSINYSPF